MHSKKGTRHVDVVIIGGGPAGTTAATLLQKKGHQCLIVEKATFPRYHVGESLIPHTFGTIARLGLLDTMKASHFPPKHSVRFVSPSGNASDAFYFSEVIKGEGARTWQVQRSEFDVICLDNAKSAGVEVMMNSGVKKVCFEKDQAVGVVVSTADNESIEINAKVVVDASGFATVIGQQLGIKEHVPGLNKASMWAYYKGGKRLDGIDSGETTIFSLPHGGWIWYIPLPDDIISVGVVGDPEILFTQSNDFESALLNEISQCQPLMARLSSAKKVGPTRGYRRLAFRNQQVVGNGWIMIGDAAMFLDPIYSSGLFLAMGSAEMAAQSIHDALVKNEPSAESIGAHLPALMGGVGVVHDLIFAFYDRDFSFGEFVKRFPQHRKDLINCLIGDVISTDMSSFSKALATMTQTPPPLVA